MKKILAPLMIICTILSATVLSGCRNTVPTPTIESRIVGKWTMKTALGYYVQQGVPRNETTSFKPTDYFDFMADGTVNISETGKTYSGTWKVDNNRIFFFNTKYIDYSKGLEIKKLTTADFQLFYTESDQFSTLEQTLNLAK